MPKVAPAVTRPLALTLATAGLLDTQFVPLVAQEAAPLKKRRCSTSCCCPPFWTTEVLAGAMDKRMGPTCDTPTPAIMPSSTLQTTTFLKNFNSFFPLIEIYFG